MSYLHSLDSFPPLALCEWSRKHNEECFSLRALWTEAEFLIFNKLRAGQHPEHIEIVIRKQLRQPLDSYYRHSYFLNALTVLNNLCHKNAFAKLPNLQQLRELGRDPSLCSRYFLDMKQRFGDFEELHAKAIDGAMEARLVACKELDYEAKELLLSIEDEARQWHEDDRIAKNHIIHLEADRVQKDIQYEELSKSWGEERPTRSQAGEQYYYSPIISRPATVIGDRDMYKTPFLENRAERGKHDRAVVDPDATIVPVWHDCQQFPDNDRDNDGNSDNDSDDDDNKDNNDDNDGDDDPFYEKYDHPSSLPQGAEPEEYLLSFGFPPPPLFPDKRNNNPPRAPSPSEFGEPFI